MSIQWSTTQRQKPSPGYRNRSTSIHWYATQRQKWNELSIHIGNVHTMKYHSETKAISRIQKLWHIHRMKCHSETKRNELSIHIGNVIQWNTTQRQKPPPGYRNCGTSRQWNITQKQKGMSCQYTHGMNCMDELQHAWINNNAEWKEQKRNIDWIILFIQNYKKCKLI